MGSSSATLSEDTWTQVGYVFSFDGTNTILSLLKDGASNDSVSLSNMYINDKSTYVDAWLMMTRSSTGTELHMWGFMYSLTLANNAHTDYATNDKTSTCSDGTCSICSEDRDTCFHSTDTLNAYWDGTENQACVGCIAGEGCVRSEDCNLCHDRICKTCFNFDSDSACTECKTNAGDSGTDPCACNTGFFFNEDNDTCDTCNANCETCESFQDGGYKFCPTCNTGFYKQRSSADIKTCLNFCPTGELTDDDNKTCTGSDSEVFEITLSTWASTFRSVTDSKSNV
jgi:hypothetical protein